MKKTELANYLLEPNKYSSEKKKTEIINALDTCSEAMVQVLKELSMVNEEKKKTCLNIILCVIEQLITIRIMIKEL